MSDKHDAIRQIKYIQQALSQNRKPIGFFIGAGCPLAIRVNHKSVDGKETSDPLIPDVTALTKCISEQLKKKSDAKDGPWENLINICSEDNLNTTNIEIILTQVRALRMVAGNATVRGLTAKQLQDLDSKICKIILEEVDKPLPDIRSIYHNLAFWARSITRDHPVHIFTTNYDLLVEQALEESAAPYFDGFIGSRRAFFDLGAVENENLLPSRWVRLWKMHGSINWRQEANGSVVRVSASDHNDSYLIYPSHLKYGQSRKMPYLAMSDRLKDFLMKPSATIFISGYSFGDEHINDVLCRTLESNPTAMAFAFLHGPLDDKYAEAKECSLRTPNLSLFAKDKGIIGRSECLWECSDETLHELPSGLIDTVPGSEDEEKVQCNLGVGDFRLFSELLKTVAGWEDSDEK